jgi:hypothetical protein
MNEQRKSEIANALKKVLEQSRGGQEKNPPYKNKFNFNKRSN